MLKIGQLAQIKSESPYVYEALTQLVNGVNAVGRATGVDPSGSIAAPSPIGGLNVTAADGIFDLAITDNSTLNRGIFYFAESDTTPAFSQPYVHFLGSSRNLRVALGNQTLYWRAYSQYLGSDTSAAGHLRLAAHRRLGRRHGRGPRAAALQRQRHRLRQRRRLRLRPGREEQQPPRDFTLGKNRFQSCKYEWSTQSQWRKLQLVGFSPCKAQPPQAEACAT